MDSVAHIFSPAERALLMAQLRAARAIDYIQLTRPRWVYTPHQQGQVQALSSDHKLRILIPGNGWGKTFVMGCDCDMLMQRDDPFKPQAMPKHAPVAAWVCQKFQQWEIIKEDIERKCFTRGFTWHEAKKYYEWPNGSKLHLLSADSDWTAIQGVQLDAVYFDEHPDRALWNELQYRRRGERRTRYMVAATMTQGLTWFVTEIVKPWEKWNLDRGRTNAEALALQDHPTTFVWNIGGIADNPAMTEEDVEHYDSIVTATEKERQVRRHGGYADFSGEAVFDLAAIKRLERAARDGESGSLRFRPDDDDDAKDRLLRTGRGELFGHRFAGVTDRAFFEWVPEGEIDGGRITIFEQPVEDATYVIGADFAAGLEGKDYDCAIVGRKLASGKLVQVAEAVGHWGDIFFAETLYALGVWFNEAFICGERQFGLPTLRRLYDEMGYTYLFHARDEATRVRRSSDKLGHHRSAGDTIIPNHRLAIRRGDFLLVGRDAITQHRRYQFKPKAVGRTIDEVTQSSHLTTGAPTGEFDDMVMGAAYCWHAAVEVVHFEKPKPMFPSGSFGRVMELEKDVYRTRRKKVDPYRR